MMDFPDRIPNAREACVATYKRSPTEKPPNDAAQLSKWSMLSPRR